MAVEMEFQKNTSASAPWKTDAVLAAMVTPPSRAALGEESPGFEHRKQPPRQQSVVFILLVDHEINFMIDVPKPHGDDAGRAPAL